ncbi:MAG TPA: TOMM precursor leader peptide-binding protein, partial [Bryobacteraceae bacterium]|nr:TOMM precursor leader peptide-binding protein [Bryobacteraceae bacterium]
MSVLASGPDRIYWITESQQGIWSASHVGRLSSLLSEPQTKDALLHNFSPGEDRESAAEALKEMVARSLVIQVPDDPSLFSLCSDLGISCQQVKREKWEKGATVMALDVETGRAVATALSGKGVSIHGDASLRVVVVSDYLDRRVEQMHQQCHVGKLAWMIAKLEGEEIWLGPIFRPGETPCWRCLAVRLRERSWLQSQLPVLESPVWRAAKGRLAAAAEFLALEVARWLLDGPGSLEATIWSFRWLELTSGRHVVARMPNCPDCGAPKAATLPKAPVLCSQPLECTPPEDLRLEIPESRFDRLEALASPITGIMSTFERRDQGSTPLV